MPGLSQLGDDVPNHQGGSMNKLNFLQPIFVKHPGVREMYAHLKAMEAYSPEFYPLGTADRYLAVAQKNWQRAETEKGDELALLDGQEESLMSA